MVKRSDKGPKAQKAAAAKTGARWTVRGVPVRLQRAAGDAARAQGLTVGQWLNKLLASATASTGERGGGPPPGSDLGEQLEQRLARLEAAVFGAPAALPPVPERGLEPPAGPTAA
jgi:hypothetical protein